MYVSTNKCKKVDEPPPPNKTRKTDSIQTLIKLEGKKKGGAETVSNINLKKNTCAVNNI